MLYLGPSFRDPHLTPVQRPDAGLDRPSHQLDCISASCRFKYCEREYIQVRRSRLCSKRVQRSCSANLQFNLSNFSDATEADRALKRSAQFHHKYRLVPRYGSYGRGYCCDVRRRHSCRCTYLRHWRRPCHSLLATALP